MDFRGLLENLGPRLKPHWMPLTVGIAGFVLLLYGLTSLLPSTSDEIVIHSQEEALATTSAKIASITVDVSGAVKNPGVYELKNGERIEDAIQKAGGFSKDANTEYISKYINLAQKIADGAKIYIPYEGEQSTSTTPLRQGFEGQAGIMISLVNINMASYAELESLSGIGKVTAEKIINGRPYGSLEELLEKKVVGSKVFEQIKDRITVN